MSKEMFCGHPLFEIGGRVLGIWLNPNSRRQEWSCRGFAILGPAMRVYRSVELLKKAAGRTRANNAERCATVL